VKGCFSKLTRCGGARISDIATRSGRKIVSHLGRTITGRVLCTTGIRNTAESEDLLCLTPDHYVRVNGAKDYVTMEEACETLECDSMVDELVNYWHEDADDTIFCAGLETGQRSGKMGYYTLFGGKVAKFMWKYSRALNL
jgi:hypothetical protein